MPRVIWAADRDVGYRGHRPARIKNIARRLAARHKRRTERQRCVKPFMRSYRKPRERRMIAYDLETTRIKAGTPRPLYLTAFGESFHFSGRLESIEHLRDVLLSRFLIPENSGCRFVAWNGNKFDVFFVGAALLYSNEFILRPYLTHNKSLRGIKVQARTKESEPKLSWEFLDGFSMTIGSPPTKLSKFLKTFAPSHQKLEGPDFENEDFDADNAEHVKYAERDSEGLYRGMCVAQSIIKEHFEQVLQPTIGNLGIRIFQANMPEGVQVWAPSYSLEKIIRNHVMRGGFCFASRQYQGPIWKYDLNQAYAHAMRATQLPAGRAIHTTVHHPYASAAVYRISGRSSANKIPFYCVESDGSRVFALSQIRDSWITSSELHQLQSEKWSIVIHEGYFWDEHFNMRELVNKLEHLRMTASEGPSGALGTMMKATGNNAYGKTIEELDGLELVMSASRPDGYSNYQDGTDPIQHVWFKIDRPQTRDYHQPQLGAFITAFVRMQVRQAILKCPEGWIYSDTDCCMFDRPVDLDIDPKVYGKWKIEADGEHYRIITKKVYASFACDPANPDRPKEAKAKGLTIKRLRMSDFEKWYRGEPPKQSQVQRQNFVSVMTGADMFVDRVKVGQRL
jgi:hypothetical protein